MNTSKILERIKLLIERSKDTSSPKEAAIALEKAIEMTEKYNINQSEMIRDATNSVLQKDTTVKIYLRNSIPLYTLTLIRAITNIFRCKFWLKNDLNIYGGKLVWNDKKKEYVLKGRKIKWHRQVILIGQEPYISICTYCLEVVYRKMIKARLEYQPPRCKKKETIKNRRDIFALAYAETIAEKTKHLVPSPDDLLVEIIDPENPQALVKINPIEEYINQNFTYGSHNIKNINTDHNGYDYAYRSGKRSANNVSISKSLNSGAARSQKMIL